MIAMARCGGGGDGGSKAPHDVKHANSRRVNEAESQLAATEHRELGHAKAANSSLMKP